MFENLKRMFSLVVLLILGKSVVECWGN